MTTIYVSKVNRRTTLKWLASSMALSGISGYSMATEYLQKHPTRIRTTSGLPITWQRIFTHHQLQLTATLSDLILPGTNEALAPSQLGIPEFVEEWVSAPYLEQLIDRKLIIKGLSWLDTETRQRFGNEFNSTNEKQQLQILDAVALQNGVDDPTSKHSFFNRLRYLVVGAYYTTPEGFRDIGYIGNVPLAKYPPVSEKERAFLEEELQRLGL